MYQTSTFIMRFASKEDAKGALPMVRALVESADDWNKRLMAFGSDITVGDDCFISRDAYRGLPMKICKVLAETDRGWGFLCYAEHLSDNGKIHEYIRYSGGLFYAYTAEEDYAQGNMSESLYTGHVQNSHLQLEKKDCNGSSQQEVPCTNCGEYYVCSEQSPVSRCPFCGQLEEHGGATSETSSVDGSDGWRSYKFEVPLGVSFPQERVSEGKDWIDDCEINDTFCLDPACFYSKNQYDAALMLCKVCAGWYRYDTDEDRMEWIACLRSILTANSGEPMWYYDVWQKSFDWVASLRDCNPKYYGCFSDVDTLWELFSRLQQRSFLEKAECFSWFVQFFGENLRYNQRGSLSDCYVQNYDNHLEMILYLCPEQIDVLIRGDTAVTANGARHLARAAAGLIRLGKKEIGIHLYESVFQMVWEGKSNADEKKAVVDEFLIRLAAGYENEPYLDAEITELLEKQCSKYSDTKWTAKIRMMLAKTNEKSRGGTGYGK